MADAPGGAVPQTLDARLTAALARLHKPSFRPGQKEAVRGVLSGRDVFVSLPTGGGKSLCYLLPAVISVGLCVVVSPLKALMADQLEAATTAGIPAMALTAETAQAERESVFAQLEGKKPLRLKCLFVTPELLQANARAGAALAALSERGQLSLVAVDEAHCVLDWGATFRPAYLALSRVRSRLSAAVPFMALTASAAPHAREKITALLTLRDPLLVMTSFDRANIRYELRFVDEWSNGRTMESDMRQLFLTGGAGGTPVRCGIVYARAKLECDRLAKMLKSSGVRAEAFHAGVAPKKRAAVLADWQAGRVAVVVATVAFGMGIDKADVRVVAHAQPAMTMTGWYQESGRAGRDGLPALNVVYYSAAEERCILSLSRKPPKEAKSREERRSKMEVAAKEALAVITACRQPVCRRASLLRYFGEARPGTRCAATGDGIPFGCDVCISRDAAAAGSAAVAAATSGNRDMLARLRAARAGNRDDELMEHLDSFQFSVPENPEFDDEGGSGGEGEEDEVEDPFATLAADVALAAGAGAADDDQRMDRTFDALERAERKASGGGSGRTGLGAELFGHRRAAPPAAARKAPAAALPPVRDVDAALRAEALAKLRVATNGAAAAAEAAEAKAFAACRGVPSRYEQHIRSAVLDAQRATSRPAGAAAAPPAAGAAASFRAPLALAPSVRAFVPPRAALPLAPAPPPQQAAAAAAPTAAHADTVLAAPQKLKSTHIGGGGIKAWLLAPPPAKLPKLD